MHPLRSLLLTAACLVAPFGAAWPQTSAVPASNPRDHVPGEILVRFRPDVLGPEKAAIAGRFDASVTASSRRLDFETVRVTPGVSAGERLEALRRDPDVVWAEWNGYCYPADCVNCPQDPYLTALEDSLGTGQNQWGIFRTGLPALWRSGGGAASSVIVAIVDTGIDDFTAPHPDLAANVHAVGHDFVDDDANPTDAGAGNLYGHGTHVAGIVAGVANTVGIAGVAYDSRVMIVRVLDCTAAGCPGSFADVAAGIEFAADNGARVINLSIQSPDPSNAIRAAIQYAIGKGCIVLAASGNQGAPSVSYPGRYPEAITVGATNAADQVASFSNYGPELDVVAPGVAILSTVPGPGYARQDGTSQATPFVSGVAAIVAHRNPKIKQAEMEAWLKSHVRPLPGGDAAKDGAGRVEFLGLTDWSDFPPPVAEAWHKNFLWEWLGADASAEKSIADPFDTDFRENIGAPQAADGHDDGVFPASFGYLPYLPPHIAPPGAADFGLSVSRFNGPRYGAAPTKSLHLDAWFDWDSDGVFAPGERAVSDHVENPATWGANTKLVTRPITPAGAHILGNPLRVRTRLNYGLSTGSPTDSAKFGEVEDADMVNYVETFDAGTNYQTMDTWDWVPDPSPPCMHRGSGRMGISIHPAAGSPCNGFIERINVMATPAMNWKEYTSATLAFWYCHQANNCSPAGDFCHVRIDTSGVKHSLAVIPIGSGTMTIPLSGYTGSEVVRIEFVEHTDWQGRIAIDDVMVVAFDPQKPATVTNLSLGRTAGTTTLDASFTAPRENDVAASPPTEPVASMLDLRYSRNPITTEAAWRNADRVDPRDIIGGPGAPIFPPGSAQAIPFRAPSAFQPYYVAMKVGDEVVNLSSLSNSPGDSSLATLGVTVTALFDTIGAPGDTVSLPFSITNTGNTSDTFVLTGFDTQGWDLPGTPTIVMLGPGSSTGFNLEVIIDSLATGGVIDTVLLQAESLADPTVDDWAEGHVQVTGGTSAVPGLPPAGAPAVAAVHSLGPNPFRSAVRLRLSLGTSGPAAVRVFDLAGRLVRTLADRPFAAGAHDLDWDGRDDRAVPVVAGLYFVEMRAGSAVASERVLKVR